tara:strand:+ start:864 stop:1697 length:834 start_codon:yes stop_codon:yes gene_type:complete
VKLAFGPWEMVVAPDAGAATLSLTRNGTDILRPTPPGATDPFDRACFPLVPYANRIAFGTFEWEGRMHHIPHNHPGQAHPLHGTGWRERWTVEDQDDAAITMQLAHAPDRHWPWRFSATHRLTLDTDGLTATLALRNDDRAAMPAGLGFHPYFDKCGVTALTFEAEQLWLADEQMLPTTLAPADHFGDWSTGQSLDRRDLIDHCFVGWRGRAVIARADGDIAVEGTDTPALHFFVPPGEAFFCAEPVTAMPDAVNQGQPRVLAPGQTMHATMRIANA